MEFVITEASDAFDHRRKPFMDTIQKINTAVESRMQKKQGGELDRGGTIPDAGEWGTVTLRPRFFDQAGQSPGGTQLTTDFRQSVPGAGWNNALAADLSSGGSNIGEDWVLGVAGFILMEPTQQFSELRLVNGDTTLPVINLEEAKIFKKAAALLKLEEDDDVEKLVWDQDNTFTLEANFIDASGNFYLKPLGRAAMPHATAIKQSP